MSDGYRAHWSGEFREDRVETEVFYETIARLAAERAADQDGLTVAERVALTVDYLAGPE